MSSRDHTRRWQRMSRALWSGSAVIVVALAWTAANIGGRGPPLNLGPASPATLPDARNSVAIRALSPARMRWLREFMELQDPIARRIEARAFAAGLSVDELREVILWGGARTPDEAAQELASQVLLRWAEIDSAAAAAQAGRLRQFLSEENAAALFTLLREPASAAKFAATLDHCATRSAMLKRALESWSSEDCGAALRWAENLPEGWPKRTAFAALAQTVSPEKIRELSASASALDATYGDVHAVLAVRWAEFDCAAALAWAGTLTPGAARQGAVASVMAVWARQSPQAAANHVLDLALGAERTFAAGQVAAAWARVDPLSAAAWLESVSDPASQSDAVAPLVAVWSQRDPVATANWLLAHSSGALVDRGLVELSRNLKASQPALAFVFADAIEARELRWQQLERVGRDWVLSDPVAAADGIEGSDLPARIKARLLTIISVP